ncbi:sulfatase [Pirellula staleyi DSM 6068]|uniref:Sulfatase n=1 Tax=Pirellula staleyi (strain ATCC 27377 / DSM 6068 / ICPB 4128) TaxID=530564 RepID=D2R323_PIRSD|nr:sulfatase [Pirellula staleyi DSM 6068]
MLFDYTTSSAMLTSHYQLTHALFPTWLMFTAIVAFLSSASSTFAAEREVTQPNIVVFLADDAGWGDYSFSGNTNLSTPHIDSIARGGASIDRFFVCSVCSPTRAEFLTGRYHQRGGVRGVSTGQERLDLSERTLADSLRAAGYATGAFGKWHNGSQWPYHPNARGFDEYFGYTSGHWGEYFNPPLEHNGKLNNYEGYIVDICTDRAITFIEASKNKPFFCYVPFTTPHSPWSVPSADWKRFQDKPLEKRATNLKQEQLDQTRCALAMVENQDRNVGRVLSKLDELKLRENTIVVYFSDNGPNSARWTGGMKGKKGTTDEGGVRSVCYIQWPKRIAAAQTIQPIAGAIDLLPTLLSLAGVKHVGELPLDGRDLAPLLTGQQPEWPERLLFTTWAGKVSARSQTHRLDEQGLLFDMQSDPGQTTPVNDREPKLTAEMKSAVAKWKAEMERELALDATPPLEATLLEGVKLTNVDARPIPLGYREFPITMLPARDGQPVGGVKRSSSAPNSSYFVNWKSTDDKVVWLVDVNVHGKYLVTIDYTCPEADAGSTLELRLGKSRLVATVTPGWDPPLYTDQDTLPRPPAESSMKPFRTLDLGVVELQPGIGLLTLQATKIPGNSVMDLRRVTLVLQD